MGSRKLKIEKSSQKCESIGGSDVSVVSLQFNRPISDIEMLGIVKSIEVALNPNLELAKP